ncbi:transcriptional regulator [Peribacillus simplex]|uniref:transcriptional regulator n=1 Tax=Peribacillus simplex TaxID=1478 RepID=UPI00366C47DB
MIRLAVIIAHNSLEEIKPIEPLVKDRCELTFLTYRSLDAITNLYVENHLFFDGIIMNNLSYLYLEEKIKTFKTPTYTYMINERDFYRTLFKINRTHKDLDYSRVCIDFISEKNNYLGLKDMLSDEEFPYIVDWKLNDNIYEDVLDQHITLSRQGRIDLTITGLSNTLEQLNEKGIKTIRCYPSMETILETFEQAINEIELRQLLENRIVIGNITLENINFSLGTSNDLELKQMLLYKSLLEYSTENKTPFTIQKGSLCFEIITSYKDLKQLTNSFTTCSVLNYLKENLPFKVNIGWGIGNTMYEARIKAQSANKEAQIHPFGSIVITENDQIIGPLGEESCIEYSNSIDPEMEKLSNKLGISILQIQKITSIISKTNSNELSSEDVSFYLGITPRGANRILNKLKEKGVAEIIYQKQEKLRGRPRKIYKIDFNKC